MRASRRSSDRGYKLIGLNPFFTPFNVFWPLTLCLSLWVHSTASAQPSSALPIASASCPARQSLPDRPCIQAIPEPPSRHPLSFFQANQRTFSEKAASSARLSNSCAEPLIANRVSLPEHHRNVAKPAYFAWAKALA